MVAFFVKSKTAVAWIEIIHVVQVLNLKCNRICVTYGTFLYPRLSIRAKFIERPTG
jgi:hypothetical protein